MPQQEGSHLQTPHMRTEAHTPAYWAMTLEELTAKLHSRQRALGLLRWLWHRPPTLPQTLELPPHLEAVGHRWLSLLQPHMPPLLPEVLQRLQAEDGTCKALLGLGEARVEAVYIPQRGRNTLCLSCQYGCTRRCVFCATASMGFMRHLKAEEMLAQFFLLRWVRPEVAVRNVVFMGMGEPMDNLEEVLRAVQILTQPGGPCLRAQKVTVSTSGILPGMQRFLEESQASLALSLNATTEEQRNRLMPQNRLWPMGELLALLRRYGKLQPKREHFVSYLMLKGLNDSEEDAVRLAHLLKGIPVRLNLIPFNAHEGSPFEAPSIEKLKGFWQNLKAAGVRCLVRWPKGQEVAAACGQLAGGASTRRGQKLAASAEAKT
ncbi:MAG: 23S rRNA (adenine(2503)-C(2))-methyltransferase RlmN [Proteobacteria bacterium]|nr:23S rRNA (adenine(2503)-C(2))-methyltransferase RlmN [Cystobacterineae bacterium]MCL2259498.1 23S rRNA (adenine(2503)-C(2))-methyltransferase RlmN [Cystobacterineae bacterium]MCL2314036.1 23S rRNA (adenine(2503)-C(2))-methyltransferase RlmN [Pseudomonadota bacterium]